MFIHRLNVTLLFTIFLAAPCGAETFKIHTAIIDPYISDVTNGSGRGVVIEVVTAALTSAGLPYTILNDVPWRRAQAAAIDEPNSLLSPFARTLGRETKWTWIVPVFEEKMNIYIPADATEPTNVNALMKVHRLGVLNGAAAESIATEMGLGTVMQPVATEAQNAQKLQAKRLDAWMCQSMVATLGMRAGGVDPAQVKQSFVLRDLPLWVVTSKSTSPEAVAKLKAAFTAFVVSPAYREILAKYQ